MSVVASIISKFDEKGVKQAEGAHDTLGSKLGGFAKNAAIGFAAAGAAAGAFAIKLGVDGVKAAIEDEAAASKLAQTLGNVTGATNAQVAAVEDYITKTTLATGVTDDELRPSLDRLVRSTLDIEEAQKLQALALDISSGSGKSLTAVTEALAKAHDGNFAAIKKLGVPLDENIIKTGDFDAAQKALAETFGGQADVAANTFAGKMGRISVAFSEAKETVGGFIIDAVTPLLGQLTENLIPKFTEFADKIGKDLQPVFEDLGKFATETLIPGFKLLWGFISETLIPGFTKTFKPILEGIGSVFGTISEKIQANSEKLEPLFNILAKVAAFIAKTVGPAFGTILGGAFKIVGGLIGDAIDLIANLVDWFSKAISKVESFGRAVANSPAGKVVGAIGGAFGNLFGGGKASGGPVDSGTTYLVGENGPELFTPSRSGAIIPNGASMGGGVTNIYHINGLIHDPEGTARAISRIQSQALARTGSG